MRRVAVVFILIVCTVFVSGCWDKQEIEQRAFVYGVAIDLSEDSSTSNPEIKLTQQLIVPENLTNMGGGGGGSGPAFQNLSKTGKTLIDISRETIKLTSRRIDVTHLNVALFSEDVVKEPKMFEQLVDVFLRERDARRGIKLVIASGKAEELLTVEPEHEKIPAEYINKMLEETGNLAILDIVRVGDIQEKLLARESFPIAQLKMKNPKEIIYEGIAVYNGHQEKVVGTLKDEEAKGLSFFRGKRHTGTINIEVYRKPAAVEILKIKTKVTLKNKEMNNLKFLVNVDVNGLIAEQFGTENVMNEDVLREFENATREKVEEIMRKSVDTLQKDFQTDALGLGVHLKKFHPKLWESVKGNWDYGENYFSQSTIDINTDVTIETPGTINRTALGGGTK
ncbi:Ger(x)C family spore germination protein [Lysinibacillus yapensis]|uniref:Ger(X)C family spore germination protein n=1 Tax=Ureibacillus yapensis TaxID=2304605 RepID=A0A396S5L9_9BACL|nr:Ger(x)C family spore germination protein [Lysinibacillus yapensis]RHW35800.1 Ger(x)C family spore germination protein [Lysinibacillus yapensis]